MVEKCFFIYIFALSWTPLFIIDTWRSHISEKNNPFTLYKYSNRRKYSMLQNAASQAPNKSSQSCTLWQQSVFLQGCSVMVKPHNCSQSISAMFMCLKGHTEQTWGGGVERESTSGEKNDPLYQYSISSSYATSHCKLRKLLLPLSIYMFEREHMKLHNWKEVNP